LCGRIRHDRGRGHRARDAAIRPRTAGAQGGLRRHRLREQLCLRGPSITPGYWRDRAATETAFRDGWLRTGDVARRDADGFYTLVDRCKDMYISGGENVYPAEVEAALLTTGLFREAAVIGVPDARWGESGVAYVVMAQASAVTDAELLALCRDRLAAYKLPREFRRVDELPRTASGKIRKDVLRSRWQTA
jgi:fatty-acyl-CoA synthase